MSPARAWQGTTTVWVLDHDVRYYDESGPQVQSIHSTYQRAMDAAQKYVHDYNQHPLSTRELHNGCTTHTLDWTGDPTGGLEANDPNIPYGVYTISSWTVDEV